MKLDIHIGDSYDRKRKIILKSDRNIDVVTAILEKKLGNIKVKYKSSKENNYKRVAVKEIIFPNPNDFSQDHLKNLIIDLDGENKSKNEILLELEKGIKPKTYEQKNKIVTAYDSWRSEYLKVNT